MFTFDNQFISSGRLSGTGRPLRLLPPSVLQPATSKARLHGVPGQKSMHVGQRGELPRARTWPQFRLVGPGPAHTPLRLLAVHGELVPVLLLQGRPQAQAGQARQGRPVHPRHIQPVHRHRQRVDRLLLIVREKATCNFTKINVKFENIHKISYCKRIITVQLFDTKKC